MPPQLARRTSPTNIGMSLLSMIAAHDLGYLSTSALVAHVERTMTTLEGLERYEGHFLNWYDTATRAAMRPHYISTVDSGNLAAALITLSQALSEINERPQTLAQRLAGVVDTAELLMRRIGDERCRRGYARSGGRGPSFRQPHYRARPGRAGRRGLGPLETIGLHLRDVAVASDRRLRRRRSRILEAGAGRCDCHAPRSGRSEPD